ncbi:MAG: hypothetical protein D6706_01025 [Chloroflexi bacterium]|nr:MAG: hypothetical protein D6706_01025 [Chloroflexota bacterium]
MMQECRVFIVGDSLFTDTLAQMLTNAENIRVTGTAVLSQRALPETAIIQAQPQIIIMAISNTQKSSQELTAVLLSRFPDIPIIHTSLNQDYIQIITSRRIKARHTDLLTAIYELALKIDSKNSKSFQE